MKTGAERGTTLKRTKPIVSFGHLKKSEECFKQEIEQVEKNYFNTRTTIFKKYQKKRHVDFSNKEYENNGNIFQGAQWFKNDSTWINMVQKF